MTFVSTSECSTIDHITFHDSTRTYLEMKPPPCLYTAKNSENIFSNRRIIRQLEKKNAHFEKKYPNFREKGRFFLKTYHYFWQCRDDKTL